MRAFLSEFFSDIWNCRFSPLSYAVFNLSLLISWSIPLLFIEAQPLYYPWMDLMLSGRAQQYLFWSVAVIWYGFSTLLPIRCGRTLLRQMYPSFFLLPMLSELLNLAQDSPLWAAGLTVLGLAAAFLWCPATETQNLSGGGQASPSLRLKQNVLLRRIEVLLFCMVLVFPLNRTGIRLPSPVGAHVQAAITDSRIFITEENWDALHNGERIQLLRLVLEQECQRAGIEVPRLIPEALPKNTLAAFQRTEYTISIDQSCLSGNTALETLRCLLHEFRHSWQYTLSCTTDLSALPEDQQQLALDFRENFENYRSSDSDGYEAYRNQLVEQDARQYACDHVCRYYGGV